MDKSCYFTYKGDNHRKNGKAADTHTLKQRVIASTPIFSPYVVFGVAPKKPDKMFARPSPSKERCKPGSFIKSLDTMLLVTTQVTYHVLQILQKKVLA